MPNHIHHLWPQWVKSDAFIQKISENYCFKIGVSPSEKCPEVPTWNAFMEMVDHSIQEGLLVSRLIPTPGNRHRVSSPSPRDKEILGRRIRLARLMARMHQKTLQVRIGYGGRSGMLSKIELGIENISYETMGKIANELRITADWFYSWNILLEPRHAEIILSKKYLEEISDGKILSVRKTKVWKSPPWMNAFIAWSLFGPWKGIGSGTRPRLSRKRVDPMPENGASRDGSVTSDDVGL